MSKKEMLRMSLALVGIILAIVLFKSFFFWILKVILTLALLAAIGYAGWHFWLHSKDK